ncbi:MAG: hypothetical protein JHC98_05255 [Thermoleophilaceae bacterium]|nr:hypothetical protein [Thermoleophilaceae bacterium]
MRNAGIALATVIAALALATVGGSRAGAGPGGVARVQPVVSAITTVGAESGAGGFGSALLGAAPDGETGEAWAFQKQAPSNLPATVNGQQLAIGDNPSAGWQSVFYRYSDAKGWHAAATPLDGTTGQPLSKFEPVVSSAAITPHGGGVLIGRANGYPNGTVVVRQPGGDWKSTSPPAPVLNGGTLIQAAVGRAPATAFEDSGTTHVLAVATRPSVDGAVEGVMHYDGTDDADAWQSETVVLPADSTGRFEVVAIDATAADNAWLIAKLDSSLGRGISLFRRDISGAQPVWREVDLSPSLVAAADTPSSGIANLRPVEQASATAGVGVDPLTVTSDGVWIDGRLSVGGTAEDLTAYFDIGSDQVTATWCDAVGAADPCDHEFGSKFSRSVGYRSTAWPGSGFGTRVITGALNARGDLSSNRGTYLSLDGDAFVRVPGIGDADKVTSALSSATSGWISPNAILTDKPRAEAVKAWSVGARSPFTAVVGRPGSASGDLGSQALAVGLNGTVARYSPGAGWSTEFLLSSTGLVRRPNLRAVAWPEASRAHAVGDDGEMWLWRSETALWEKDGGAPLGFNEKLTGVAFDPSNPSEGYAIGRNGTMLHYGKSWTKVCFQTNQPADPDCDEDTKGQRLPDTLDFDRKRNINFLAIAYAGGEPLVIGAVKDPVFNGHRPIVLVRRNGAWQQDQGATAILTERFPGATTDGPLTVTGLVDGAAFIGGDGIAIERDSAGGQWHGLEQPLPPLPIIAAALYRENGKLRVLASVTRMSAYTAIPDDASAPSDQPQPLLKALYPSAEGFLMRQTDTGWQDIEQGGYLATRFADVDRPFQPPPIQSILAGGDGDAWVVGGSNSYETVSLTGFNTSTSSAPRNRVMTSYIARFDRGGAASTAGQATATPVEQSPNSVNFVVGANATCEVADCADFANAGIAPDVQLSTALNQTARMSVANNGPRFFMYAGGRRPDSATSAATDSQLSRLSNLLSSEPDLAVFAAVSSGDSTAGSADAWKRSFAGFPAPLGSAPAKDGVTPRGAGAGGNAQTHYSFESTGATGRIRVIVIDNSRGTLAASDPHQYPAVASQYDWLRDELRDAKAAATPAVVIGSRDLNQSFGPKLNAATDEDARRVATLLRDEGASAYFFDRPEENRAYPIPAGESNVANTIPSFGTGTLGYRSVIENSPDKASSLYGETGMLLAQVDVSKRNPQTNRAPVSVRMIPLVSSLNIEAIDGTLLRRSRPALFSGIAARPPAGDRWGANASPAGSDPYTTFPTPVCTSGACNTRLAPEYKFTSSDPDIADFVAVDPQSSNLRKPLVGPNGKPVSDPSSGLLCAYNAGTTNVSISAGGQTYSRTVTVQPGTAQPPCGTVPLSASRFTASKPNVQPPPPPAPLPLNPVINLVPPAPPVPAGPVPPAQVVPTPIEPFILAPLGLATVPVIPPPPPPSLARPIPPTGGMARAPEKQRDDEVATEDSQAFTAYRHDDSPNYTLTLAALILLSAAIGVALPGVRRGSGGTRPVPARIHSSPPQQNNWRTPR